jgi:hypothetical protein
MAINDASTLCALVDNTARCVCIYSIGVGWPELPDTLVAVYDGCDPEECDPEECDPEECDPEDAVTFVNTGSTNGILIQLDARDVSFKPIHLCFVHRGSVETLLVAYQETRSGLFTSIQVCEISVTAVLIRRMPRLHTRFVNLNGSQLWEHSIAYAPCTDIIAVGMKDDGVRILDYVSGAVLRTIVTISISLAFSADGRQLFVAKVEYSASISTRNVVVEQFSSAGDSNIPACKITTLGPKFKRSAFFCSLMCGGGDGVVVCSDVDGVVMGGELVVVPHNVTALARLGVDLCYRSYDGGLHVVRDRWWGSLRAAWITACV